MKTKINLFILALALIPLFGFVSGDDPKTENGIKFFTGTFAEAKTLAQKEGKLIFLDAYAQWCGPCKMMTRDVFPNKKVGEFYNANFINMKMDMEKGEGKELSKQFAIRAYPTLLFIDASGKIVAAELGYRSTSELIEMGKKQVAPKN